jgi:hypothetical protein
MFPQTIKKNRRKSPLIQINVLPLFTLIHPSFLVQSIPLIDYQVEIYSLYRNLSIIAFQEIPVSAGFGKKERVRLAYVHLLSTKIG